MGHFQRALMVLAITIVLVVLASGLCAILVRW